MCSANGMIRHWGLATSLLVIISSAPVAADVSTERGSSIIVFPKVIFDSQGVLFNSMGVQTGEQLDTLIQISNTSNSMVFAHCFYVNAAPEDPARPVGPRNPPRWQEVNFDIWLTKQQPTHWVVGSGRREDPRDPVCTRTQRNCSGAGFDPGLVVPLPDPFAGELKCIEVDSSGAPINGNHLKGEATIVNIQNGDASKYNAIGVLGLNTDTNFNNSDFNLCLGGGVSEQCPAGAEYNGCPQTVILNHFAEGASNPVIEVFGNGPSAVSTELTLVPCRQDLENQIPASVTVQFRITNEFEERFSASSTVTCWGNFRLSSVAFRIFDLGTLGSRFAQTHMTAAPDHPGFLGVAEEFHFQPVALMSRAAVNLHTDGVRPAGDLIIIPEGP